MRHSTAKHLFTVVGTAVLLGILLAMASTPSKSQTAGHQDCKRLVSMLPDGWSEIVHEAKEQRVNWWMWAGDAAVNRYSGQWVAGRVKELYDIDLKQVAIKDTVEGVQQVVQEKTAGKHSDGAVDLNWISSENLKTMMQGDMLCNDWAFKVPNAKYIDFDDPTISHHGVLFVGDDALAWSRFQYVLVYDSNKVTKPPRDFKELADWIKANPGKFTYPAPPDFTGRGILESLLFEVSGGFDQWRGEFNSELWEKESPKVWEYLNDIKPYLWRKGETYPENVAAQERLYSSGEIWWSVSAYFATPGRNVEKGVFPKSTRTMVVPAGTLSGTGAVSIPYNSGNKAAAMVVADFLASPEAQYQKSLPQGVADGTILDLTKLSKEWQDNFKSLPKHDATLPFDELAEAQVPLIPPYHVPFEKDWRKYVLK